MIIGDQFQRVGIGGTQGGDQTRFAGAGEGGFQERVDPVLVLDLEGPYLHQKGSQARRRE